MHARFFSYASHARTTTTPATNRLIVGAKHMRIEREDTPTQFLSTFHVRVLASSRLGVVYVPPTCVPPSSAFKTWLDGRVLGALLDGISISHTNKLKARLGELAHLLMWPTLKYMASRGDTVFREEVMTFQVREHSAASFG